MNKRYIIWAAILLTACREDQLYKKITLPADSAAIFASAGKPGKTVRLPIDPGKSLVAWKGTKLKKTGQHQGTVKFSGGELLFESGKLQGGHFEVDLRTIYITDIPLSEPVPRQNLTRHLNEDFETGRFPRAKFTLTRPPVKQGKTYTVTGNMLIKGITQPLTIEVEERQPQQVYEASFTINRLHWGIGKNRSWLQKKLVDAEVELKVLVVMAIR